MGKTLEKLRRSPALTVVSPAAVIAVETTPNESDVAAPAMDDTLPYIEVGGKDRPMEASPDVLACTPARPGMRTAPAQPVVKAALDKGDTKSDKRRWTSAGTFATGATLRLLAAAAPADATSTRVPGQIAPWLIAHHDPAHPISRQYYELLRGVRQTARARRDARALLFVSSEHGIGATSALLNLAITAAREGKGEVLIVDGHFADPGVADQLELPSTPGLSDVLTGEIAWQEAVQSTPIKSLQVLAAGRRIAALQVTAPALTQTFKQVSARFATVFVDGPCCDEIELALRFCVACDCIFAVVPHDRADSVLTADLVERFAATGCHVSGAIVTQN